MCDVGWPQGQAGCCCCRVAITLLLLPLLLKFGVKTISTHLHSWNKPWKIILEQLFTMFENHSKCLVLHQCERSELHLIWTWSHIKPIWGHSFSSFKTVEAIWGLENSNETFYVLLVEEGLQMSRCQMWISGLSVKLFFKMMSLW